MNSPNTSAGVSESSFIKPPPGHWKLTHPELSTKRWDEDGNLIVPVPEDFDTSQSLQQRFARGRGGRGAGRGGRAYGLCEPTEPESNGPRLHGATPESVDKVRKMYCSNCGAQVTSRCEEPHCMRGQCCHPKPGCARCYYAAPPPVPTQVITTHLIEIESLFDLDWYNRHCVVMESTSMPYSGSVPRMPEWVQLNNGGLSHQLQAVTAHLWTT